MRPFVYAAIASLCLILSIGTAQAAPVPITVYPDPINFATVAQNSPSYLLVYLTNTTANNVTVQSINVNGTNSSDFGFVSPTCVGTISGGQYCQMNMVFTPGAMGNRTATLQIAYQGSKNPINIPLMGIGGNPIPTITSTAPASAYTGSAGFSLTVNGQGFLPTSVASFNSNVRTTTYVSSMQIRVAVLASDLQNTNQEQNLSVFNPAPGGGGTSFTFPVISPIPTVGNLSPNGLVAGTGAATLIINGNNFSPNATVLWNGKPRSTTYVPNGPFAVELHAELTAADVSRPGIDQVAVSNPAPGGTSAPVSFEISFPAKVRTVNVPANDLVWDPYERMIYATVPSSFGKNGNSFAKINPYSGTVKGYSFAGSEPNHLALSDDGQYAYVGLDGSGSVQRFILPGFVPDINIGLGTQQFGGPNTANELRVVPGSAHTVGVVLAGGCCGSGGPLEFFTDSTQLPNSITSPTFTSIEFADASTLYGFQQGTLSQIAVDANGGTLGQQWSGFLSCDGPLSYLNNLVYGPGGEVLNTQTGTLAGSYSVSCNPHSAVVPSGPANRVFAVQPANFPNNNNLGVEAFSLSRFTPISGVNLSDLNGNASRLIRWGNNGLAFLYSTGCCNNPTTQILLLQSAMVLPIPGTSNPLPMVGSLVPNNATHGSGNLRIALKGSGFVAGSTVTWNGSLRYSDYVSSTQLTVYIPASDLAAAGSASVQVSSPTPGGGLSGALTFAIK
jgi:hypothetical protein